MTIAEFVYTVLLRPRLLRRAANATIRAMLPERVRVGEATVWINPDDPVISGALTLGVYERGEIAYFRSKLGADMTFIDIGANVGLYSAIALSTRGFRGRVLAVEPHAESRLYLQKTIESNAAAATGAAQICGLAASDRPQTLTLYKNCRRYGIASAQFIKIDVQGAEARVIRGATGLLAGSRDCILMTEFWPYGLSRCGADGRGYLEMLQGLGFRLYELSGSRGLLAPVGSPQALVERTGGRRYANLVGLKGNPAAA